VINKIFQASKVPTKIYIVFCSQISYKISLIQKIRAPLSGDQQWLRPGGKAPQFGNLCLRVYIDDDDDDDYDNDIKKIVAL
jgi:hypothetical protein